MTAEQKKKSKEFLHRLHTKHYGKVESKAKDLKVPSKTPEKSKAGEAPSKGLSRNELMLQAKARGIKNFRVINKQELIEILKEDTTQERINEIVAGAVARWRSGWGVGKKQKSNV